MTDRSGSELLWPAEPGAARLYRAVQVACASGDEFAERVDAGLAAALSFLEAEPDLTRDLAVLGGDAQAVAAQRRWVHRFGELLRGAATDLPDASSGPRFREPFLIDGIRFQIGRRVLVGETARLRELRPELLDLVLAYYRDDRAAGGASTLVSAEREARSR